MPAKVIFGTYHVIGREPDGDSIAFKANDAAQCHNALTQLASWAARKKDPFVVIETGERFRFLGDMIEVNGREVSMKFSPLEISFTP